MDWARYSFNKFRRAVARLNATSSAGFSIVETTVSVGLLSVAAIGVAQLFAVSGKANLAATGQTSTTVLATQKMEQLRSLTWGFEATGSAGLGLPMSDTTTNLSVDPPTSNGTGLQPTPEGVLDRNLPPYVDYLDANGAWLGTGANPPANTVYIRRWSIEPLPTNPNNTLVLQVLVMTLREELSRTDTTGPRPRMLGDARLVSVKTRKAL
jgi:hypothetical protein